MRKQFEKHLKTNTKNHLLLNSKLLLIKNKKQF